MPNWSNVANSVSNDYGTFVDFKERFFICPECGEPIYENDWNDSDFEDGTICPICDFNEDE